MIIKPRMTNEEILDRTIKERLMAFVALTCKLCGGTMALTGICVKCGTTRQK